MEHIVIAPDINFTIYLGNLNIHVNRIVDVSPNVNWRTSEHLHADFEFHLIPEGRGYVEIEGTELEVNAGEFYITGPFVNHSQVSDKLNPMREYCLECEIQIVNNTSEAFPVSIAENQLLISLLSQCLPQVFQDSKGICAKFAEILSEEQKKALGYMLRMQSLIIALLIDIFRIVAASVSLAEPHEDSLSSTTINKQRINRLLNFIHFNYKQPLKIKDTSAMLFLSEGHINRLMKKALKCTFQHYLANFRLNIAIMQLQETDHSIENIALESGFGSVRYMYQVFKKAGHLTPSQIRAAHLCSDF